MHPQPCECDACLDALIAEAETISGVTVEQLVEQPNRIFEIASALSRQQLARMGTR